MTFGPRPYMAAWLIGLVLHVPLGTRALGADRVADVRIEYMVAPLGLDEDRPRFSWVMSSNRRGARQTAYRVQVSRDVRLLSQGKADTWDSDKIASEENAHIEYAGPPLQPRTRYHVRVQIWDEAERLLEAPLTFFETGKRDEKWQAEWIGLRPASDDERWPLVGARWIWARSEQLAADTKRLGFFTSFSIGDVRQVAEAELFVAAPGDGRNWMRENQHRLWINEHEFRHWAATNADPRRIPIGHALRSGENKLWLLSAYLADKAVIATVRLRMQDGRERFVKTGPDWRVRSFTTLDVKNDWIAESPFGAPWAAADDLGAFGQAIFPGDPTFLRLDHIVPPIHLRRRFVTRARPTRARLYATAAGVYEAMLNGHRVADHVFAPGWTDYKKRIQYQSYDVTRLVVPGKNVLAALVGDGWFVGRTGMGRHLWGFDKAFFAELHLEYADGSREIIATDGAWRGNTGAIRSSDMLDGEVVDARRELFGWSLPSYDDTGWRGVSTPKIDAGKLVAQRDPPVRALRTLRVKAVTQPAPKVFVYDLGQNMVGWIRAVVQAAPGTRVRFRYAEVLDKEGNVYTDNLRTALATDLYIARGRGSEVFEPHFTFHGFRYVEVTGLDRPLAPTALHGVVVNSDLQEVGSFRTSNPLLNQLHSNIVWGQRGNYLSIPTDCPQRDERLGWTGDIQVFARTGTFNMDSAAFLAKYLDDLADAQFDDGQVPNVAPTIPILGGGAYAWGDAIVILPYLLYEVYADRRVMARHFDAMKKWVDFRTRQAKDFLNTTGGFGDWVAPVKTPHEVTGPIYHARSAWLLSRMAEILGKPDEAAHYAALFGKIRRAFEQKNVAADGTIESDTQTAYVLALRYEMLADEARRTQAVRHLEAALARAGYHLETGFLGTGHLLPVLSAVGRDDLALRLLLTETYPSWLYTVKNGATTMWERWNSYSPETGPANIGDMNSYNHYAFGAVGEWMYSKLGAIDIDPVEPGYRNVVVAPAIGAGIERVRAQHRSLRGTIATEWRLAKGKLFFDVNIPVHASATVSLPSADPDAVTEGGRPARSAPGVEAMGVVDGRARFRLRSGAYQFILPAPTVP